MLKAQIRGVRETGAPGIGGVDDAGARLHWRAAGVEGSPISGVHQPGNGNVARWSVSDCCRE